VIAWCFRRVRRSASGYRFYGNRELERLEQTAVLRFIGLPLKPMRPQRTFFERPQERHPDSPLLS
jgi:hypothetical protein